MKKLKSMLLVLLILINALFSSSCWNYREIDKLSIVAGVAVDKGTEKKYLMTAEVIKISPGRDSQLSSETISAEGDTLFDAIRNIISYAGKRLYWGHAKVIIYSQDIAKDGMLKVIDWYKRDAETREDVKLIISKEPTANEIFKGNIVSEKIKSMVLVQMIDNQSSLSKAPNIDISTYDIQANIEGASVAIPAVCLVKVGEEMTPELLGSAIIKDDKLAGFLTGDETKAMLFIRDEVKGGLLVENIPLNKHNTLVTLEIFKSKSKTKPQISGKKIKMNITTESTVAIDEIEGKIDLVDEKAKNKLEEISEKALKSNLEALIKKMQSSEYDADIFGFGLALHQDKPKEWEKISKDWGKIFKEVKVDVETKIKIKNTGIISKSYSESE